MSFLIEKITEKHISELHPILREKAYSYRDFQKFVYFFKSQPGVSYAILDDNKCISMWGIYKTGEGIGHVWFCNSDVIKKKRIWFCKYIKRSMLLIGKLMGLHRLEANVKDGYTEGARWAEHMGLKREGLMRKFSPLKEDYILYSFIYGEDT